MNREFHGTFQVLLPSHNESTQISAFIFPRNLNWSYSLCQIFIFFCSFSWLTSSYKALFFSSCRLLVYDQNQWGLKLSTAIYKMQLLYTTHSKTPVVYMLRHNLCHLPPERYWSSSVNALQKGPWVQAQGNLWLLGLSYNLINNDLFLELCFLVHCLCDLTSYLWFSLHWYPLEVSLVLLSPSLHHYGSLFVVHANGTIGGDWNNTAGFFITSRWNQGSFC